MLLTLSNSETTKNFCFEQVVCVSQKYALSEEKIHRKFSDAVHKNIPGKGFRIPWAHHVSGCHGEENFPVELGGEFP